MSALRYARQNVHEALSRQDIERLVRDITPLKGEEERSLTPAEREGLRCYSEFHMRRFCYTVSVICGLVRRNASVFSVGSFPNQIELLTKHYLDVAIEGSAFNPLDKRRCFTAAYEVAGARHELPIHLLNLPAEPLPFPDGSFDACFFFEVIEHLPQRPDSVVREIQRVLKPGGLLFTSTPNAQYFHRILKTIQGYCYSDVDYHENPGERHERVYSMTELTGLFGGLGMRVIFSEHVQMWPEPSETEMAYFRATPVFAKVLDALGEAKFQHDSLFVVAAAPGIGLGPAV